MGHEVDFIDGRSILLTIPDEQVDVVGERDGFVVVLEVLGGLNGEF